MFGYLSPFIISHGYIAIFIVMMGNSDFLPLFTEVALPFAGFMASQGKLSIEFIILASVLGDLIGGIIAYYVGYFLQENLFLSLIKKYGKFIFLREKDYLKAVGLLRKYGTPIVFFAKLTPGFKTYTSVAAGISKINLPKFIIVSVLASIIYNSILTYLGVFLGKNWVIIEPLFRKIQIVLLLVVVIILLFVLRRLKSRKN